MHAAPEVGVVEQGGVEEERPPLGVDFLARVCFAAELSGGYTHQGVAMEVVGGESVGEFLQGLVADEEAIDVVVVERVAAVLQLVVVNDRDEGVQFGGADVAGVVVDAMNLEYFLHFACKNTQIQFDSIGF